MSPPKRRSQTRNSTPAPPSPAVERKPLKEELLNDTDREERFKFSFQEEGLTVEECAQKMESFQTKEDFLATIHVEEVQKFLTKVFLGRPGQPFKCFNCTKVYASSTGWWYHFKKCLDTEVDAEAAPEDYRNMPCLWQKVPKREQEETLRSIVGDDFTCFASPSCTKSFKTSQGLIRHLETCILPAYLSFMDNPEDFRKLDIKTKNKFARDALRDNASVKCLVSNCDQVYSHYNALVYHVDRCGVEKSEQPWKCYRCGYEATGAESEAHLLECAKRAESERNSEPKVDPFLLSFPTDSDPSTSAKRRRTAGGGPRATARKDGSTLFRFRKSTVNREFNGIVTKKDQKYYEEACSSIYDSWKIDSELVPFCDRLKKINQASWKPSILDKNSKFYRIFNRKSVTIRTEKAEGLQDSVPSGIRIDSLKSETLNIDTLDTSTATVAYCGAPINGVEVAPGKTIDGDDVICVTTFANETDLESDSSVVQFWRHRVTDEKSEMNLWFLLHIPTYGTILSMRWLQKNDTSELGLIGFVAFSTTSGKVLIYRIDSTSAPYSTKSSGKVSVVNEAPQLILSLPVSPEISDEAFMNATIKVEGEDVVLPMKIDESAVPILKIAWSAQTGGDVIAAITGLGAIVIWNLNFEDLQTPRLYIGADWQSPPTDIAFLNDEHLVIGFKEKLVKVVNIYTWEVKLEENTMKTAGARVHTDPRIVNSFFTFQSEYTSFPYSNATSIAYVHMELDSMNLILIPTGNTHQLMSWDIAMCAPLGTLLSCGIDGRLIASASGRLLRNTQYPFFANRSLMSLKRRRVLKEVQSMEDFLTQPKTEGGLSTSTTNDQKTKPPLEKSIVEHDEVCEKMWLEVGFDQSFEPTRAELSCRDQRIESLNCVDATTNIEWPVTFTGGEAGLLFAVSSKLIVKEVKL